MTMISKVAPMSIFIFLTLFFVLRPVIAIPLIRILPLGEALRTGGSNSDETWYRNILSEKLSSNGYNADILGSTNVPYYGRDKQTILQLDEDLEEILDKTDPDVVLLLVGTVDIEDGDNVSSIAERWGKLIEKIAKLRPFTFIIASNLPVQGEK